MMQLFCIPFAGGSASYYNNWKAALRPHIECIPVELPGRGYQFGQPFLTHFDEATEYIVSSIIQLHKGSNCSIFGHSMGALLAYEVTQRLNAMNKTFVSHLFISATQAPAVARNNRKIYLLSDELLIEELRRFGGMPTELYSSPELLTVLLPIIRADFNLLETYRHDEKRGALKQALTVLAGLDDLSASPTDLQAWSQYTNTSSSLYSFQGGHFYINDNQSAIINLIYNTMIKEAQ